MSSASVPEENRLGRYQVLNKIAEGGMAEIFLAKALGVMGFERLVAIKLIHSNLTKDSEFVKMFIDEARIAMHLHHRNIVQVFDLDQAGDTYFIAMEYVQGVNLYDLYERIASKGRWIELPLALYVVAEVAKGLHFAHTRTGPEGQRLGIVHRDISPQNVLLSFEGEVKITDFGIAKAAERLHVTMPGIVKGKYAYMAPEVLEDKPADARVDVFACGVLLYELLVGENPFAGATAVETIENVLAANVPAPSQRGASVAAELDLIALKSLARNPANRYQSGQELAEALTEYGLSLTQARRDIAAGDSAIATLLTELFPEKANRNPVAAPAKDLKLPVNRPAKKPEERAAPLSKSKVKVSDPDEDSRSTDPRAAMDPSERDTGESDAKTAPYQAIRADQLSRKPPERGTNPTVEVVDREPATDEAMLAIADDPSDAPPIGIEGSDLGHDDATLLSGIAVPDDMRAPAIVPSEPPPSKRSISLGSQRVDQLSNTLRPGAKALEPHADVTRPPASGLSAPDFVSAPVPVAEDRSADKRLKIFAGAALIGAVVLISVAMVIRASSTPTTIEQLKVSASVVSEPAGATVTVNEEAHPGATPLDMELPAGLQAVIVISKPGFKPHVRTITPQPGVRTQVQVALEPILGSVTVTAKPDDARISVLDRPEVGGGKLVLTEVRLGQKMVIRAERKGHLPQEQDIVLTPQKPDAVVFFDLKKR